MMGTSARFYMRDENQREKDTGGYAAKSQPESICLTAIHISAKIEA